MAASWLCSENVSGGWSPRDHGHLEHVDVRAARRPAGRSRRGPSWWTAATRRCSGSMTLMPSPKLLKPTRPGSSRMSFFGSRPHRATASGALAMASSTTCGGILHDVRLAVDPAAAVAEDVERLVQLHPDAGALEDDERAAVDHADLVVAEHGEADAAAAAAGRRTGCVSRPVLLGARSTLTAQGNHRPRADRHRAEPPSRSLQAARSLYSATKAQRPRRMTVPGTGG